MTNDERLLAEIQVDEVLPQRRGFTMIGTGGRTSYRLELRLGFPLDTRTRRVLGELLSQSEWRISQLGAPTPTVRSMHEAPKRNRARKP